MGVLDTARSKGIHRPHLRNNEKINKAAGVVGHGRNTGQWSAEHARQHRSAPLSTLQDPASFGAPPRHHTAQDVAAETPAIASGPPALPTSSKPASKPMPPTYASRGLGAALPKSAIQNQSPEELQAKAEEEARNAPPPVPYRLDTTGLSTTGLPKPPVRRTDQSEAETPKSTSRLPASYTRTTPQPPPRLPVRQNSHPDEYTPEPPPPYASPPQTEQPQQHQPAAPTSMGQLSELQAKFAKLPTRVSSPPTPSEPQASDQGTTWQQKQAAMRTAGQLHQDPSTVSASDAYSAAKTAHNFQQRHGEQISSGFQKAKALDSKYGVSGKVAGMGQGQTSYSQEPEQIQPEQPASAASAAAKKAPPPPPPPKRREIQQAAGGGGQGNAPPPVPLASKPK